MTAFRGDTMGRDISADHERRERKAKREAKQAAATLRQAMTDAWTWASRHYAENPERCRAAAWGYLGGHLRGLETYAGVVQPTDPDGVARPES